MKTSLLAVSGILTAAVIIFFFLIELYHGPTGEGLAMGKEMDGVWKGFTPPPLPEE